MGYRFSNRSWDGWPLTADRYAEWIRATPGRFVLLAWDFETFGEHHNIDTGIFEFLKALPGELRNRGVSCMTPTEAAAAFGDTAHDLPLTPFPATWAGVHGGPGVLSGQPRTAGDLPPDGRRPRRGAVDW